MQDNDEKKALPCLSDAFCISNHVYVFLSFLKVKKRRTRVLELCVAMFESQFQCLLAVSHCRTQFASL